MVSSDFAFISVSLKLHSSATILIRCISPSTCSTVCVVSGIDTNLNTISMLVSDISYFLLRILTCIIPSGAMSSKLMSARSQFSLAFVLSE